MGTKITILSDTHCYSWNEVDHRIRRAVSQADLAIHCGDIVRLPVLAGFRKCSKRSVAVHGNSDPVELKEILPYTESIEIEGLRLGITHPVWGREEFPPTELFNDFEEKPDIIVFGHTHQPLFETIEETLFVNPGQAYKSFMVDSTIAQLNLEDRSIKGEIITIR